MKTPPFKTDRSRRELLRDLAAGALALKVLPSQLSAQTAEPVASAKFADVFALDDNVWAVISKPLTGGFETVCNGAFVAGSERVVMFDAFASPGGAEWVLEACRKATGRTPTDLVLSHKHMDHVGGLKAFAELEAPPKLWTTEPTRSALPGGWSGSIEVLDEGSASTLDVGGGSLELLTRSGHTASDVFAVVDDRINLAGDLFWNFFFPNFVDARPLELQASVRELLDRQVDSFVPGHGNLPSAEDFRTYAEALTAVETAARQGHEAGTPAGQAAAAFKLPSSLGDWTLFGQDYFEKAFKAWYRDLGAPNG
ncbi:MAG: MBL fold metallo-hydrolase [Acidobacteriota bacterium]